MFMFLCHRKLLPTSLLKYYSLNCNIHSHATRNAANFHIPKARTMLSCIKIYCVSRSWAPLHKTIVTLQLMVSLQSMVTIYIYLFIYSNIFSRVPIQHSVGLPWGPEHKNMIQL